MRRSLLLIVSVAVNLLLLAVVLSPRWNNPAEAPSASSLQSNLPRASGSPTIVRRQFFSWNEVESPDYPVYIARLREIGCPEQTIRDIVIADVNQLFDRKRLEEVPTADQEWWRSEPDTNFLRESHAKAEQLELQRRALLDNLLGPNWSVEDAERLPIALNGPVLGELSDETKQAVRDIVARGEKQMGLAGGTNGTPSPAEMVGIEQQVRADLAKILTAPQLEEFLLRYSSAAANLRGQLQGFDVTPDQFRRMFDLRDPIEQQLAQAGANGLPSAVRANLEKQLDDAIKTVLGPDQYQAFRLSSDPDYQNAVALAASNNAPSNVVDKLYQIRLLTKQEVDRINQDPSLTPDQKAAQIASAQQQAQAYSDQLLGNGDNASPPLPPVPPPPPQPAVAIHPFANGDTLDMIAKQYGVSATSIMGANPGVNLSDVSIGTPIRVPLNPPPAPPAQ